MLKFRDGTRKNEKHLITQKNLHKAKQQVDWCIIGALLVLGRATGKFGLTRLTTTRTWGSHHLPPYSILCGCPRGPHPNGILSQDSQVGVSKLLKLGLPSGSPKIAKVGTPVILGPHNFAYRPPIEMNLKEICSPC